MKMEMKLCPNQGFAILYCNIIAVSNKLLQYIFSKNKLLQYNLPKNKLLQYKISKNKLLQYILAIVLIIKLILFDLFIDTAFKNVSKSQI